MSVVLVLITASLLVATGFLISFLWAVKNGQYEDDYSPSVRILIDHEVNKVNNSKNNDNNITEIKTNNKI